ncbi:MAG: TlpA family protein disulfide reductase [Dehalococcoidia bacterium]
MKTKNIFKLKTAFFSGLILFLIFFISILFVNQIRTSTNITGINKSNKIAPTFITSQINGEKYIFNFENKSPTVITFWASWCPPCRKEMPILDEIQKENKNIRIIGINIDEDIEDAKEFLDQYNITFLSVIDEEFITIKYGVTKIPETFFIDPEGKIISRVSGNLTKDKIKLLIDDLVN